MTRNTLCAKVLWTAGITEAVSPTDKLPVSVVVFLGCVLTDGGLVYYERIVRADKRNGFVS